MISCSIPSRGLKRRTGNAPPQRAAASRRILSGKASGRVGGPNQGRMLRRSFANAPSGDHVVREWSNSAGEAPAAVAVSRQSFRLLLISLKTFAPWRNVRDFSLCFVKLDHVLRTKRQPVLPEQIGCRPMTFSQLFNVPRSHVVEPTPGRLSSGFESAFFCCAQVLESPPLHELKKVLP